METMSVASGWYVDFLILLIPTLLVYICSFFAAASLLFVHF